MKPWPINESCSKFCMFSFLLSVSFFTTNFLAFLSFSPLSLPCCLSFSFVPLIVFLLREHESLLLVWILMFRMMKYCACLSVVARSWKYEMFVTKMASRKALPTLNSKPRLACPCCDCSCCLSSSSSLFFVSLLLSCHNCQAAADAAIAGINNSRLRGKNLRVSHCVDRGSRSVAISDAASLGTNAKGEEARTVFIRNLPRVPKVEDLLRSAFTIVGVVAFREIMFVYFHCHLPFLLYCLVWCNSRYSCSAPEEWNGERLWLY